jgi:hypothetical protein
MADTKQTAPTPPPAGPKKTAEDWALAKGHLPETKPGKPRADFPQAEVPPIHNLDAAKYKGALFGTFGGVYGREVTEAEYDAAVKAAADHVYR